MYVSKCWVLHRYKIIKLSNFWLWKTTKTHNHSTAEKISNKIKFKWWYSNNFFIKRYIVINWYKVGQCTGYKHYRIFFFIVVVMVWKAANNAGNQFRIESRRVAKNSHFPENDWLGCHHCYSGSALVLLGERGYWSLFFWSGVQALWPSCLSLWMLVQ